MKFWVFKSSWNWADDHTKDRPCKGAEMEEIEVYCRATEKTMKKEVWVIDVQDISKLVDISFMGNPIIIHSNMHSSMPYPALEIYDTDRES